MTRPSITRSLLGSLLALLLAQSHAAAQQDGIEYRDLPLPDGGALQYAVVLPEGFDAARPYPILFALPPGRQDRAMVDAGLARYWGEHARRHRFVVVSPVAPAGESFHGDAGRHLPALLHRVRLDFRVDGNQMHLAGASNGGRSAFRLATQQPQEFQSLTVLPGHPVDAADVAALGRLTSMVVTMFVGGDDGAWVDRTEATAAQLRELGVETSATVLPGEGHVPPSLDGGVLMDHIAGLHARRPPADGASGPVERALDDFHDAAAKADEGRYFARFADDGVFLGTDAEERWTRDEFVAFATPYFQRESAWVFVPAKRWVTVDDDAGYAWFHEVLGSASYGESRGTGTMRRVDGVWRMVLYDLTVPVPNELLGAVAARIRDRELGLAKGITTVYLVRHAEKGDGDDPELSEAGRARAEDLARLLRSVELDAVYATEYRRTQQTVAPAAVARSVTPIVMGAGATAELARLLQDAHRGDRVLVAGHSNTVPSLLRALGIEGPPPIADDEYDDLFVVTLDGLDTARMTRLHYGTGR